MDFSRFGKKSTNLQTSMIGDALPSQTNIQLNLKILLRSMGEQKPQK